VFHTSAEPGPWLLSPQDRRIWRCFPVRELDSYPKAYGRACELSQPMLQPIENIVINNGRDVQRILNMFHYLFMTDGKPYGQAKALKLCFACIGRTLQLALTG